MLGNSVQWICSATQNSLIQQQQQLKQQQVNQPKYRDMIHYSPTDVTYQVVKLTNTIEILSLDNVCLNIYVFTIRCYKPMFRRYLYYSFKLSEFTASFFFFSFLLAPACIVYFCSDGKSLKTTVLYLYFFLLFIPLLFW